MVLLGKGAAVSSKEALQMMRNMTHLTQIKLDTALRGNITLVIHFNADYSAENRRALKGYYLATKRLVRKDLGAEFVYVDCKSQKAVCTKMGIHYFPQTYIIVRGRNVPIPMKGRTQKLVVDSIVKKIRNSGIEVEDRPAIQEVRKQIDRFFFYIGHADDDYEIFKKYSAAYPFIPWYYCLDRGKIAHANGIYFYDEREGTSDMINGPHGPLIGGRMHDFTHKYMYLLRSLPDYAMDRIFVKSKSALILFYPDTDEERGVQIPYWHAAMKVKHKILTLQVPMKDKDSKNERNLLEMRKWLGVENPFSPAVRIVHKNKEGRWVFYQLRDKITVDSIELFCKEFFEGKMREFHRSERPERGHQVVKELVGKNYKKSVSNKKYHVLSVIYSMENESVSKRALKVVTIVAKILARFEYLRFVKVDAEYNSDDILPQRGFPFVRLYRKEDKKHEFVEYKGLLSAKALSQWICDQIKVENPFDEMIQKMKKGRQSKKNQAEETEQDM
jgi:hypothetical protein